MNDVLIDAMSAIRKRVSKTDLVDALIRIGIRHQEEAFALLRQEVSSDGA